jgi:hypothetical protein
VSHPARLALLTSLALLLAASLACSTLLMGDNERFIQGTWTYGTDLGDGHGSYLEVTFTPGYFNMEGYPPLEHSGRYQVASALGNSLTLRLTHQAGDLPGDDRDMVVVIDRAAGTLTIDGSGPYTRLGP